MKRIKNIFINTERNKLKLADILFDDKIFEIQYHHTNSIEWNEVDTLEKLNKFKAKYRNNHSTVEEVIDGNFLLAIPGGIDPHVHFDTPGFEFRDDFEHASTAAAYGGVTTIIDMPCTSLPPVTTYDNFLTKLNAVKNRSLIDFAFWGGIERDAFQNETEMIKQIQLLSEAGVAGFKVYTISGMDTFKDLTYQQIEKIAPYVNETGKPVAVHAEDKKFIFSRMNKFIDDGRNTYKAYCEARSDEAEFIAVKNISDIANKTGCRFHIVHLSSEKALNVVREARKSIENFSAETCPQYLHFTQKDFENPAIKNFLKTAPPVKNENDKNALWEGLKNGDLIFVTTDHAGCNPDEEKKSENFREVYGGIPGLEHRIPFLFSEGFKKERLTLEQTIKHLSTNAAEYFKLPGKGSLKNGNDADFALINLWKEEKVAAVNMHSKGKYTPFEGEVFTVKVEKTFLRGNIIMERVTNFLGKTGTGKFIKI